MGLTHGPDSALNLQGVRKSRAKIWSNVTRVKDSVKRNPRLARISEISYKTLHTARS
jgi:hypothetical protein